MLFPSARTQKQKRNSCSTSQYLLQHLLLHLLTLVLLFNLLLSNFILLEPNALLSLFPLSICISFDHQKVTEQNVHIILWRICCSFPFSHVSAVCLVVTPPGSCWCFVADSSVERVVGMPSSGQSAYAFPVYVCESLHHVADFLLNHSFFFTFSIIWSAKKFEPTHQS